MAMNGLMHAGMVQSFGWAIENNAWHARVASIAEVFAGKVSLPPTTKSVVMNTQFQVVECA